MTWSSEPPRLSPEALREALSGPCISCGEASVRSAGHTRESMPSSPSAPMVVRQLNEINPNFPDPEQHRLDPESHCNNPKCDYRTTPEDDRDIAQWGKYTCPQCGNENVIHDEAAPRGSTRAGLTLDAMGQIGEDLVGKMHEIPGVGVVTWQSNKKNFPIDAIIQASDGTRFGVEIKTNHSEASPRFKLGDAKERQDKLTYCMENGLKPALLGVRLNFYNDLANVFWREGMSDTWFGNKNMRMVGTINFSDLNPFQSPNPQTKEQLIQQTPKPDQSMSDDSDIDAAFGPALASYQPAEPPPPEPPLEKLADAEAQPRLEDGRFTFSDHVHHVKVVNDKGNHESDIKRCKHCGVLYEKPTKHQGRFECPTCGEDPERKLMLTKVIAALPEETPLDFSEWQNDGATARGHRRYIWQDPTGYKHIVVGNSQRKKVEMDQAHTQQRMRQCMTGACSHARNATPQMAVEAGPEEGVFRPGDQVNMNGTTGLITDIDGNLALLQNLTTGEEDIQPIQNLQRAVASKKPDYLFVYYLSGLKVEKYHHNTHHSDLVQALLAENKYEGEIDHDEIAAGEVFEFSDGSLKIEHTRLGRPTIQEEAEKSLREWFKDKEDVLPAHEVDEDKEGHEDNDSGSGPTETSSISTGEYDHWRRLPRDDDGQWQALSG